MSLTILLLFGFISTFCQGETVHLTPQVLQNIILRPSNNSNVRILIKSLKNLVEITYAPVISRRKRSILEKLPTLRLVSDANFHVGRRFALKDKIGNKGFKFPLITIDKNSTIINFDGTFGHEKHRIFAPANSTVFVQPPEGMVIDYEKTSPTLAILFIRPIGIVKPAPTETIKPPLMLTSAMFTQQAREASPTSSATSTTPTNTLDTNQSVASTPPTPPANLSSPRPASTAPTVTSRRTIKPPLTLTTSPSHTSTQQARGSSISVETVTTSPKFSARSTTPTNILGDSKSVASTPPTPPANVSSPWPASTTPTATSSSPRSASNDSYTSVAAASTEGDKRVASTTEPSNISASSGNPNITKKPLLILPSTSSAQAPTTVAAAATKVISPSVPTNTAPANSSPRLSTEGRTTPYSLSPSVSQNTNPLHPFPTHSGIPSKSTSPPRPSKSSKPSASLPGKPKPTKPSSPPKHTNPLNPLPSIPGKPKRPKPSLPGKPKPTKPSSPPKHTNPLYPLPSIPGKPKPPKLSSPPHHSPAPTSHPHNSKPTSPRSPFFTVPEKLKAFEPPSPPRHPKPPKPSASLPGKPKPTNPSSPPKHTNPLYPLPSIPGKPKPPKLSPAPTSHPHNPKPTSPHSPLPTLPAKITPAYPFLPPLATSTAPEKINPTKKTPPRHSEPTKPSSTRPGKPKPSAITPSKPSPQHPLTPSFSPTKDSPPVHTHPINPLPNHTDKLKVAKPSLPPLNSKLPNLSSTGPGKLIPTKKTPPRLSRPPKPNKPTPPRQPKLPKLTNPTPPHQKPPKLTRPTPSSQPKLPKLTKPTPPRRKPPKIPKPTPPGLSKPSKPNKPTPPRTSKPPMPSRPLLPGPAKPGKPKQLKHCKYIKIDLPLVRRKPDVIFDKIFPEFKEALKYIGKTVDVLELCRYVNVIVKYSYSSATMYKFSKLPQKMGPIYSLSEMLTYNRPQVNNLASAVIRVWLSVKNRRAAKGLIDDVLNSLLPKRNTVKG